MAAKKGKPKQVLSNEISYKELYNFLMSRYDERKTRIPGDIIFNCYGTEFLEEFDKALKAVSQNYIKQLQ